MDTAMRLAALAVMAALCASVVRRGGPEFALLLSLAAGSCILWIVMGPLEQALTAMEHLAQLAQLDEGVLRPVLKTVGLSLVTKITSELCRSAGEGGIAAFLETAGTIAALAAALPLAQGVLELIVELLT